MFEYTSLSRLYISYHFLLSFILLIFLLHNHVHFRVTKCCYTSQLHIQVETWVPLRSFYICTHYFVVYILLGIYTKYINFISELRLYILLAAKLLTQKGKKKEKLITKIAMFGVWAILENAEPNIELSIEAAQSSWHLPTVVFHLSHDFHDFKKTCCDHLFVIHQDPGKYHWPPFDQHDLVCHLFFFHQTTGTCFPPPLPFFSLQQHVSPLHYVFFNTMACFFTATCIFCIQMGSWGDH